MADRLTYANVLATVALFISLGGASYAAIVLPPNSVGTRQLQRGAVTAGSLSFPLGATSATNNATHDLTKGPCDSPPPPGESLLPCAVTPLPPLRPGPFVGANPSPTLRIWVPRTGQLAVTATVALRYQGGPGTNASVTYAVAVDHLGVNMNQTMLTTSSVTLLGGQAEQAPVQMVVPVARGEHTVEVFTSGAHFSSYEPGDLMVGPVSVVAIALP